MSNTPSPEAALERARQFQQERLNAVQLLVEKRHESLRIKDEAEQRLADVQREAKKQISNAEREDLKAYNDAIRSGWTEAQLKDMGLGEPRRKVRSRRKALPRVPNRTEKASTEHPENKNDEQA